MKKPSTTSKKPEIPNGIYGLGLLTLDESTEGSILARVRGYCILRAQVDAASHLWLAAEKKVSHKMTQAFIVLLAWWAGSTVDAFLPHKIRSVTFRRQSYLNAALNVGDAVIAEVDDILGSVSDPKVSFLVSAAPIPTCLNEHSLTKYK